jgi:hypothetical protein
MRHFISTLLLIIAATATTPCFALEKYCDIDDPAQLYAFQDQILEAIRHAHSPEELQEKMAKPLKCLAGIYKESNDLLEKYVAGACLQRLMGGPEIAGVFKRDRRYDIVYESLLNQQLEKGSALQKTEIADLASGKWADYVNFCKGSVTESMCSELLPTNANIKNQNELLGATSMLVLRSAYHQFSGPTKKKIAKQIAKLYKETAKTSPLKRRVIDQIYREINSNSLELRGS